MAGTVLYHVTMSLDGFFAGPVERIARAGGYPGLEPSPVGAEIIRTTGAILADRRVCDLGISQPGGKPYGGAWSGPVFVLTHSPPAQSPDPTIRFLSGTVREAIATAREAAGGKNVVLFGASIPRQCL